MEVFMKENEETKELETIKCVDIRHDFMNRCVSASEAVPQETNTKGEPSNVIKPVGH